MMSAEEALARIRDFGAALGTDVKHHGERHLRLAAQGLAQGRQHLAADQQQAEQSRKLGPMDSRFGSSGARPKSLRRATLA